MTSAFHFEDIDVYVHREDLPLVVRGTEIDFDHGRSERQPEVQETLARRAIAAAARASLSKPRLSVNGLERRLITTTRDCAARLVPTGDPVTIPGDTFVTLTQSLGGTYTIIFNGNMARIDSEDADALGFEPDPSDLRRHRLRATVDAQLRCRKRCASVFDPEIPVNVVDLGLIYDGSDRHAASGKVAVVMTLTAPGCGMGDVLVEDIKRRVSPGALRDGTWRSDLVFDPPWSREMMSGGSPTRARPVLTVAAAGPSGDTGIVLEFFDDWEDKYRFIIDLGKALPAPAGRRRKAR